MPTIGHRLKEERKRLGLNQTAFAELGGVKRKAQGNYESNGRRPDAEYLADIGAAGADITYIVTGDKQNTSLELNDKDFIDFSKVCCDLGLIVGCNYSYAKFLYARIEETGKFIDELTVKELLAIHDECGRLLNN